MNKSLIIVLTLVFGIAIGIGSYHFFFNSKSTDKSVHNHKDEESLYTCGMHPNIIESEPGNCPICGMKLTPMKGTGNKSTTPDGEREILYWRAPMDPNEIYEEPGKSKMGMDLVPVYADEAGASGVVTIDGSVIQNMNVKVIKVKSKELVPKIFTNGILTTDERKEYSITTKASGWIEKLYINYTGQEVSKGQKLVDIYSPELVAAQQELLTTMESYGDGSSVFDERKLVENAKTKLKLFDITEGEIEELIKTKKIKKYMTLYSPVNGTVLKKNILEGEKIKAGKELMKIANLSNLWLHAELYEGELGQIEVGSDAKINFSYKPEKTYNGKVTFIHPTVDPKTRTIKARIEIPNTSGELKPAMFGNVIIEGNNLGSKPSIPETSVLRSGKKTIVIVSLGEGRFKPKEIQLGQYSDSYYQVLNGLEEGDLIVSSGQFMIDSESSLRSAVQMYTSSEKESSEMDMDMDNKNEEEMQMDMNETEMEHDHSTEENSSIVREGIIDVEAIDKNGDGKVFQDPMDWNVISDEPGRCPLCEMKLKEYTIENAKKNLKKHGYEYK